jgi:hypothetical protein
LGAAKPLTSHTVVAVAVALEASIRLTIAFVHRHAHTSLAQALRQIQAANAAADDQNVQPGI